MKPGAPPGFLRLFVVFHESEALGAGRSVLNAIDPLEAFGWSASAWFPGEGPLVAEAEPLVRLRMQRSKPIRYSRRGWRSDPGVVSRLRDTPSYLKAFRRALLEAQPHVVHANTLRSLPEARVARGLGLPVVLHVHELPHAGPKRTLAFRAAAGTADVLVAVSEAVARALEPHVGRTPVVVAYNGVPHVPESSSSVGRPAGTVGTVGTVCRTKGTDLFLEAARLAHRECPDLRFEHVGQWGLDGDVEFERRISELASSPALRGVVSMLGGRPATQALAGWELFVLPSRQDSFPLATLEAMAAGVTVVAADVGGVGEQIAHLESGILVEPESPEGLARWIVSLHRDSALRERLAREASRRVETRFTVDLQAAALHRAYLAALNLRHGPPPVRRSTLEAV